MPPVRCSPTELEHFVGVLRGFVQEARDGHDGLHLSPEHWRDQKTRSTVRRIQQDLLAILQAMDRLDELANRGARLAQPLHGYLQHGRAHAPSSGLASAAAGVQTSRLPTDTGRKLASRNGSLRLWSFRDVDASQLDWGVDQDFPERFDTHSHHGNQGAAPYRSLVSGWVSLFDRTRGEVAEPGWGTNERASYDAFVAGEPVVITINSNGKIHVDAGRHRTMAAIEAGATIPVKVNDLRK